MPDYDHEKCAAREVLCRLLAACYYEPGPEFAEERVFDAIRDAANRTNSDIATRAGRLSEAFEAEAPAGLLLDYTRLFLGPNQALAQPYASIWLSGEKTLMQDSTIKVLALYHAGGFEPDDNFRDLPDHIAVELEFLYLLIFRENRARQTNDINGCTSAALLRKRFLEEHLAVWIGPFTSAIEAGASTTFYRELAGLTRRFVEIEAEGGEA